MGSALLLLLDDPPTGERKTDDLCPILVLHPDDELVLLPRVILELGGAFLRPSPLCDYLWQALNLLGCQQVLQLEVRDDLPFLAIDDQAMVEPNAEPRVEGDHVLPALGDHRAVRDVD